MQRNATLRLTAKDKQAAKQATTVVRSHYGDSPRHLTDREKIYRAGNAIAAWVGLDSWIDIPLMQHPEHVAEFHRMIQEAV